MAKSKTPQKSPGVDSATALPPVPKDAAPVKVSAVHAQLPLPEVRNATANSTLPPLSSTAGTDVIITAAIASGAKIEVYWAIQGNEATPIFSAVAHGTGSAGVKVPVPAWVIGYCIGQTVSIWYESGIDASLWLELTVEVIDPNDMPQPKFLDLVFFEGSWKLDMTKFPGNAQVQLCSWPFIAAGQRLWVEAVGNEHLSPLSFHWILEDHVVTAEEAQDGFCFLLEILRSWLELLEDWSSLTIHAGITFDGAPGAAPEDPGISHIPANAHEIQRATANLRVGEPDLKLLQPNLREAVYVEGQGYVLNPTLTVNGGHVEVVYDGMRAGDHVCVKFEGTPGPGSPLLSCQDVQGGQTKLVFPVPASAFSANFGRPVVISFTVLRDRLWPSLNLTVQVLELAGLSGIDVEEKTEGKLCLSNFSGPANAIVASWDYIAQEQTCWMWIDGKYEDGSPFHWDVLVAEPVKPEWVSGGVSTLLAREELERLADCLVFEIHFAVHFQGLSDLAGAIAFRPLQLQMVQADLLLLVPQVLQAVGSHLTVWNGRDGVTVRVKYDRMSPHHTIELCWKQAGACLALAPIQGNITPGYVDFDVPREAVIHGIGKTVPIRYSVSSRCKQQTSQDMDLEISVPVRLPSPVIPQATPPGVQHGILDLATFNLDALITVLNWWFALAGQHVWLKCTGTKKDGNPHTFYAVKGKPLTLEEVNNGLKASMIRAQLELLKHDTRISVTCLAATDESERESSAIVFPVLNLILKRPLICDVETFEGLPASNYTAGGSVQTPLMKITFLSGASTAGVMKHGNNPFYSGNHFAVCRYTSNQVPPQVHRVDFTHALESIKFGWVGLNQPAALTFYDQASNVITEITYPGDSPAGFWAEYVTTPGTSIAWMTITASNLSFVDNFSMSYRT